MLMFQDRVPGLWQLEFLGLNREKAFYQAKHIVSSSCAFSMRIVLVICG
jgi:hypothetical protein